MMRLLTSLILIAASVALGLFMHNHPGYVLLQWNHLAIETTLWAAVLAIFASIFLISLLKRLIYAPFFWPKKWQDYRKGKKLIINHESVEHALADEINNPACANMTWRNMAKKAHGNQSLYALTSMKVALKNNQLKDAAYAFEQAKKHLVPTDEASKEARCFLQAQLEYQQGDIKRALTTLSNSPDAWQNKKHMALLTLALQIHQQDFEAAWITYTKRLENITCDWQQDNTYTQALHTLLIKRLETDTQPTEIWYHLPRAWQDKACFVSAYIHALIKQNDPKNAATACLHYIKKQKTFDTITLLYAQTVVWQTHKQLKQIKGWQEDHPNNPVLLNALGYILIQSDMPARALTCFEEAQALESTAQTLWMIYRLQKQLGQVQEAEKTLDKITQALS